MSCLVAFGFLLDAACKCFGDVYTGLVGNAETAHLQRINRTDLIPYIQYDTKHGKGGI